jgi:hypothetical protein
MLAMTGHSVWRWPILLTIALEALCWAAIIAIAIAIWSALL